MLLGLAVLSISAPKPDSLGMTKGMPFGAALAEVRRALAGVPPRAATASPERLLVRDHGAVLLILHPSHAA